MTVVIVDDHSSFRSQLRWLLETAGFEVIGEAADGASGITAVRDLQPRLVVLDVQLPDMDGFDVAELVAAQAAGTAVVMVSTREARDYQRRLAHSAAVGFISKADMSARALSDLLQARP